MPTVAHFIDVGEGNMTLLRLADGRTMLYDCNVTEENSQRVLRYLARVIPRRLIHIFVNSHRDADHMRGLMLVHRYFPIQKIWDSGVTGGSPDCTEYREYMELRRRIGSVTVVALKYWDFGRTRIRIMNAENDDLPDDSNAQSLVLKVQHHQAEAGVLLSSVLLAGDSDAVAWKHFICQHYADNDLRSSILLASHHGSITFFDDPDDEQYYYVDHIKKIKPQMTVVSVGPNPHGHPDPQALELYERFTSGSAQGNKVFRTDEKGTLMLELKDDGGWSLRPRD